MENVNFYTSTLYRFIKLALAVSTAALTLSCSHQTCTEYNGTSKQGYYVNGQYKEQTVAACSKIKCDPGYIRKSPSGGCRRLVAEDCRPGNAYDQNTGRCVPPKGPADCTDGWKFDVDTKKCLSPRLQKQLKEEEAYKVSKAKRDKKERMLGVRCFQVITAGDAEWVNFCKEMYVHSAELPGKLCADHTTVSERKGWCVYRFQ